MRNITIYIYQCGKGTAPQDWVQIPAIDIQRLYYIKGGSGSMRLSDGSHRLFEPGKLYLIPSNMQQSFTTAPDSPIDHIYFDFYTSPPIIAPEAIVYEVKPGSALEAQVGLLDRTMRTRGDLRRQHFGRITDAEAGSIDEYCQLCIELLHTTLLLMSQEAELPFTSDRVITKTLDYIRENYTQPIEVSELADLVGFESNYFIRRFKRVMGITPYAYLKMQRLMRARELLMAGETVMRAAELVGYENASSLSRALSDNRKKGKSKYL